MTEYWNKIEIGQNDNIHLTENLSKMQEVLKDKKVEYTLKHLSKSYHLRSMSMGFEIEYIENKIQTFFVYFRTKKMSSFKGILPFGINQNWTLRSAVLFFGQPLTKSQHMVEIIYENLGLGMVFQGNWMRDQSLIQYCYFFQPSTQKICSSCKGKVKQPFWKCQCKGVGYCSQSCKTKHQGLHQIICQNIDNQ